MCVFVLVVCVGYGGDIGRCCGGEAPCLPDARWLLDSAGLCTFATELWCRHVASLLAGCRRLVSAIVLGSCQGGDTMLLLRMTARGRRRDGLVSTAISEPCCRNGDSIGEGQEPDEVPVIPIASVPCDAVVVVAVTRR